ncbi:uncharacterized protein LOC128590147 [Nycticebus coucang]|uniref:uncharacterized protein LOC128590147 n=1 Tax=Nycticebus coucang TaxID=9470 RepID=UPI00234C9713|nr:uncharacterized protein LOC128590147 [Nycticebus coucang]
MKKDKLEVCCCPRSESYSVSPLTPPYTPPSSALPREAAQPPPPRAVLPERGRGLPQAAASASSPRGSWCLPGPTGLTRTTQPQDVRSDGTTASCHAPPLPLLLPLHRRVSVRQRRRREHRANVRVKEDGLLPTSRAEPSRATHFSFFLEQHLLTKPTGGWTGRAGDGGGSWVWGEGRRVAEPLRPREASRTGRRPWEEEAKVQGCGKLSCLLKGNSISKELHEAKPQRSQFVLTTFSMKAYWNINSGLTEHSKVWSPTPGPWTSTREWPIENRAAQQEDVHEDMLCILLLSTTTIAAEVNCIGHFVLVRAWMGHLL